MIVRTRHSLRHGLLLSSLLLAAPAFAGPPLLCDPFDTAGAPSLAWGGKGWNQARTHYDLATLVAQTEALLGADVPVIARMETLRRAAIYASREGRVANALAHRLEARADGATERDARALAAFDSGYYREALQEIVRLQGYDMPGIGKVDAPALRALLAQGDGNRRIDEALALRPRDPALRFAAALVARADERRDEIAGHVRIARAGVAHDRLLAANIGQVSAD
ncbi:MAG: hypothetical protein KA124_00310 [Luteimonas sp.]|nr:hypothetical protein [Luteimonas sp.]